MFVVLFRVFRRPRDFIVSSAAFLLGAGRLRSRVPTWVPPGTVGFALGVGLSLGLILSGLLLAGTTPTPGLPDPLPTGAQLPVLTGDRMPGISSALAPGTRLPPLTVGWLNGPPPTPLPAGRAVTVVDVWADW